MNFHSPFKLNKINSTQILGFIFVFYDWPFPHMYFAKTVALLILGSVFSDCVIFYGDCYKGVVKDIWEHGYNAYLFS